MNIKAIENLNIDRVLERGTGKIIEQRPDAIMVFDERSKGLMLQRFLRTKVKKMIFRVMTIADYEKVYQLWLSCKGMGLNNLDDSEEGIAAFLKRNPNTCFVCEEKEQIVGVILTGHDGRRGYVYHTAVHPEYRRCGIGSNLVKYALDALKAEGIHKVAMLVFAKNETGNAFWEREGFTERTDITYRNKALAEIVRIDT